MKNKSTSSRRTFLKQMGSTAALLGAGPLGMLASVPNSEKIIELSSKKYAANDKIRIGCIGMGIMGFGDVKTAVKVPGVEFVAASDLYTGHLDHVKELYGQSVYTTKDYRQLLERKDIDAVIIATPDHWHDRISIDAMKKGKAVYCEKPMVHHVEEGHAVIEAQRAAKVIFQVGSQRVSSIMFAEAKKLIDAGNIGEINLVEGVIDRHSALGAWQYSIPTDASPQTVNWENYLGDAPKRPYDPLRFFRWRNYQDYGTGVPGDLFVHLITGLHFVTNTLGPRQVYASGSLSLWKDGRDVPDVMAAVMHYPANGKLPPFHLQLRVNLADGSGGGERTRIVGTEGVLEIGYNDFVLKNQKLPLAPGYGGWDSFNTFTKAEQENFVKEYNKKFPEDTRRASQENDIRFTPPKGYDDRYDHFVNFFDALRSGKKVVEDAAFGLRAAGPALLCNESHKQMKSINWDAEKMRIVSAPM